MKEPPRRWARGLRTADGDRGLGSRELTDKPSPTHRIVKVPKILKVSPCQRGEPAILPAGRAGGRGGGGSESNVTSNKGALFWTRVTARRREVRRTGRIYFKDHRENVRGELPPYFTTPPLSRSLRRDRAAGERDLQTTRGLFLRPTGRAEGADERDAIAPRFSPFSGRSRNTCR